MSYWRQGLPCLLLLGLLLLAASAAPAAADGGEDAAPPRKTRSDAAAAGTKEPAAAKRVSKIVATAGETELVNGIGDVQPDGACRADVRAFCKDVSPGDDRLVHCLARRVSQALQGNIAGRSVSDKCQAALAEYKAARARHINRDVVLARACKDDAEKLCKDASDTKAPGSVLLCLRKHQKKASSECKGELLRTQAEAAQDYRLDPALYDACHPSVERFCRQVEPGSGQELDCLLHASTSLDWGCLSHVLRVSREAATDIRLNLALFRACAADAAKHCPNVEPGHMRVQECLEDAMERAGGGAGDAGHGGDGFSTECRSALEGVIAARVADFRLDAGLQEACEEDLAATCSTGLQEMEADAGKRRAGLNCLQQFREQLHSRACREQVHRALVRASRDIRFNDVLASACSDDRKAFCSDVQPGSARVIRCLQEHRPSLSQHCAAALFDHEVKMAEDIDFKYPTRRACAWEVSHFCKGVAHGHARVVRCLQSALSDPDMSPECKAEVTRDTNRMAQDYRLNFRLASACKDDVTSLCGGLCDKASGQPCGGVVLQCLQDKQDNITSTSCQEEVAYFQLMEVTDFRNDVILAEACRADVDKYCKDVQPGEGRVHACLRFHRSFISPRCAAEENKLAAAEHRDIRLRPKLARVCSAERAAYCKDVKPGKARVIRCLVDALAQPGFGEECRSELSKRQQLVKNDYRYDVGVASQCGPDIDRLCAAAKTQLHANATVLKCLVQHHAQTGEPCQAEVSRAVRYALWDFQSGQALSAVCDGDVDALCPKGAKARPGGLFTIGAVGRCLSKALVSGGSGRGQARLTPGCRALVLVAAPRDSRLYLEYPESTSALITKIAELQRAAGLESVLVDPYRRDGAGSVTVTGWLALAAVASLGVVALGGLVMLWRRLAGVDRPHTQYVKSGDA